MSHIGTNYVTFSQFHCSHNLRQIVMCMHAVVAVHVKETLGLLKRSTFANIYVSHLCISVHFPTSVYMYTTYITNALLSLAAFPILRIYPIICSLYLVYVCQIHVHCIKQSQGLSGDAEELKWKRDFLQHVSPMLQTRHHSGISRVRDHIDVDVSDIVDIAPESPDLVKIVVIEHEKLRKLNGEQERRS